MRVLSLFDGMSCGQLALHRVGVKYSKYYASEIDKYAMQITQKNFPDTIQIGDVKKLRVEDLGHIDLVIGGSPCQNLSFAGKLEGLSVNGLQITTLEEYLSYKNRGIEFKGQSYLFWEYVRVLEAIKKTNPNVLFLLENVKMPEKWRVLFDEIMGVEATEINSALVSAQDRKRYYWTNLPVTGLPEDKNISLVDILLEKYEEALVFPRGHREYTNYDKEKVDKSIVSVNPIQVGNSRQFGNAVRNTNKAYTLRATNPNGILDENWNIRRFDPIEVERLQTVPDKYTEGVSKSQRYKMLGNGWTVDIIAWIFSFIEKKGGTE